MINISNLELNKDISVYYIFDYGNINSDCINEALVIYKNYYFRVFISENKTDIDILSCSDFNLKFNNYKDRNIKITKEHIKFGVPIKDFYKKVLDICIGEVRKIKIDNII